MDYSFFEKHLLNILFFAELPYYIRNHEHSSATDGASSYAADSLTPFSTCESVDGGSRPGFAGPLSS